MTGWEYMHVQAATNAPTAFVERMNVLGTDGWEVVSIASADKTVGLNAMVAILKRELVSPPPPADPTEGWKADPTGRFDTRHWSGRHWTLHVSRQADKSLHKDPPTMLPPTKT